MFFDEFFIEYFASKEFISNIKPLKISHEKIMVIFIFLLLGFCTMSNVTSSFEAKLFKHF